ncbi:MAG: hypothetical protein GY780_17155 [bacterium]|nr:hypothetical protein [bacterium]
MNGKVLKGCGIGCGAVSILIMIVIGSLAFFVKDMTRDYKEVAKSEEQLSDIYGQPAEFQLSVGGLPTADRIEAFITIREQQAEWRQNVALAFDQFLVQKEGSGGLRHFFKLVQSTTEMAPSLAGFWMSRNGALLENEMSPGEYSYLYCLAYYSYLSYDPGDGAQDTDLDFARNSGAGINIDVDGELNSDERKDLAWRRVHQLMLPLLESVDRTGADAAWLTELDLELGLLRESELRYPWSSGAPRLLADVFRPYRRQLEIQYNIKVNPVELIFEATEDDE